MTRKSRSAHSSTETYKLSRRDAIRTLLWYASQVMAFMTLRWTGNGQGKHNGERKNKLEGSATFQLLTLITPHAGLLGLPYHNQYTKLNLLALVRPDSQPVFALETRVPPLQNTWPKELTKWQ